MAFCRFCGKELVNGQCDCSGYRQYINNIGQMDEQNDDQYQQDCQDKKEPFLNSSIHFNFSSFSGFVSSMRDLSGTDKVETEDQDPYEYNIPIVPDCIEPEKNEIVVKQYNIAKLRTRLKFMKAEGRLMVTNRRVLFRAAGTSITGNILQNHQFNLDEIRGIEIHKDTKFSILSFIGCLLLEIFCIWLTLAIFINTGNSVTIVVGIILGFLGLLPTVLVYKRFWLKLFCSIIGSGCFSVACAVAGNGYLIFLVVFSIAVVLLNILIICFVPNLVIKIKTTGGSGAIVIGSQKMMFKRDIGDDYSGFIEVMPWEDTVMAMNELGTLIDDLQKHGDYAIEKWTNSI